jgi:SIR2-like domain/Protein kinase domain
VAPERIEGAEVDSRADVYALGAVLFECLTGEPPFRRDTPVATVWAHVHERTPSTSMRRPDLPVEIDDVLARALAKTPAERHATCADLMWAVRAALGVTQSESTVGLQVRPHQRALVDHCRSVLRTLLEGRVVPVLGTGSNVLASPDPVTPAPGRLPPAGLELAAHLAGRFGYPSTDLVELPRVSQYVAVTHGDGPLWDELHDLLDADYVPAAAHRLVATLPRVLRGRGAPPLLVVTTGYDAALEWSLDDAHEDADVVGYVAAGRHRGRFWHRAPDGSTTLIEIPNAYADASPEKRTVVLRLRGGVDRTPSRERESFVVTEDDYIGYLDGDAGMIPVAVAARLRRSHLLFLGYDVRDWHLRVLLRRLWGDETGRYRSWAVLAEPDPVERQFWLARGVEVLEAPLHQYLDVLPRVSAELESAEEP